MRIPLSSPDISEEDIQAVVSVLRTPNLSLGPKPPEFEEKIAAYTGVKYAVAVNSGTSGLHLCIRALGIGPGDEVITVPFSFVASANCMLFEGAIPKFVDIRPDTLCIDTAQIEKAITAKTKAILAVDVFGHPAEWDELTRIAKKNSLLLIEDSCEAIGATYKGRRAGTFGECGLFAFYPNKQMTTGEGGVIVTNREDVYHLAKSMRNQGRAVNGAWLQHERLGYNYRLSDVNCALGISQLSRLDALLKKRHEVAMAYHDALKALSGSLSLQHIEPEVTISWFVYVVHLNERFSQAQRDRILEILRTKGIGCSNYFSPIHLQPYIAKMFGHKPGDFPVTEKISARSIALPFFNQLRPEQIGQVVDALREAIHQIA